jgi:hypothetical protein
MTKRTDFEQPQQDVVTPDPPLPMTLADGAIPPLYGNENYVSDRPGGRSVPPPVVTGAEWLAEAKELETVLYRGDAVSYETLERLFLQSVPVIEAAGGGSQEPAGRKKKSGVDDDDDQDKRNRG